MIENRTWARHNTHVNRELPGQQAFSESSLALVMLAFAADRELGLDSFLFCNCCVPSRLFLSFISPVHFNHILCLPFPSCGKGTIYLAINVLNCFYVPPKWLPF